MSPPRLFLSGIRAEGRHGARPGEKDVPQPFVVDLDLEVDAVDDWIDSTADYRAITDTVREIIEQGSFDLIETMADAIARRVASDPRVATVTAVVHKPNAAGRLGIDGVAAAATATGAHRGRVGRHERRRFPRTRFEPRGSPREPPGRCRRHAGGTRAPGRRIQPGVGDDARRRTSQPDYLNAVIRSRPISRPEISWISRAGSSATGARPERAMGCAHARRRHPVLRRGADRRVGPRRAASSDGGARVRPPAAAGARAATRSGPTARE